MLPISSILSFTQCNLTSLLEQPSHTMSATPPSQHPSLQLGPWRIPALLIPLISIAVPVAVRSRPLARHLSIAAFHRWTKQCLTVLHLLFYVCMIWGILSKPLEQQENDVAIALLEYTSLIIGEAILRTSDFWPYTRIAAGWFLICPHAFQDHKLSQLTRTWLSLLLAIFSALTPDARLGLGARLSALTLLTTTACRIWSYATDPHKPWSAMLLVIILAPLCAATYGRKRVQIWYERLICAFPLRIRSAWDYVIDHSQIRQCVRCAEGAMGRITLALAGLILSSFNWSCFRWRWLMNRQPSRAPSWTTFSFFGGGLLFYPILVLIGLVHLTQDRPGDLMQRQLHSSLAAVWWTTCVQLVAWIFLETIFTSF
jgi:hypothetical protein